LKRKDVNSNGKLEPNEMSDNTRSYLKKSGFNPEKSLTISKVLSKLSKDKAKREVTESKTNRTRKVAGFGVEKEESESGVARFGTASTETKGSSPKKTTYSESVTRQVDTTLSRYDRNKDGSLDREEMGRARWGSPTPQESDTNKDGRLSRSELSDRYASRESAYSKSSSSSSSRNSSRSSSSQKSSSSSYRPSSTRSTSSSRDSSTTKKPVSSSSSSDSKVKYEKYAASLIGQYDANKDGKLSSEETKKMRRPPVGADQNKDGFITKSELFDSLSGVNKPAAKSSSSDDSRKSTGNSSSSRSSRWGSSSSRSPSSKSSSGSSRDFEQFDKNEDRQVQMHEYSAKWDDKTVKEFYEKDKNGDGVITIKEWASK
jgi:Ca2+-binding EF-hand superfamily protein